MISEEDAGSPQCATFMWWRHEGACECTTVGEEWPNFEAIKILNQERHCVVLLSIWFLGFPAAVYWPLTSLLC